ncbi:MAG: LemA family protein [Planctomycetaceae bacterium]|nr:MAG: LemA family protein [Planctomycetaceae bacterium]
MLWFALGGTGLATMFVMYAYNSLIAYRNAADNALSTVDVLLQKRWDLIPNLVAAAKGYMAHESQLLQRLIELRQSAMSAGSDWERSGTDRARAENALSGGLGQFRAVVENYPQLRANENFLHLQASLNECEEQLSAARRAFNSSILQYNNSVEMFPHRLVAGTFGFTRRPFFEIQESNRAVPNLRESLT